MYYLLLLIAILLAVISGLLIKLHLMHKAVLEITEAFRSKVSSDREQDLLSFNASIRFWARLSWNPSNCCT